MFVVTLMHISGRVRFAGNMFHGRIPFEYFEQVYFSRPYLSHHHIVIRICLRFSICQTQPTTNTETVMLYSIFRKLGIEFCKRKTSI